MSTPDKPAIVTSLAPHRSFGEESGATNTEVVLDRKPRGGYETPERTAARLAANGVSDEGLRQRGLPALGNG